MMVPQLAFSVELRRANHHALASRDVGEHLCEKVLNELERADRLSELQALLSVPERMLVGAHLASRRLPPDEIPRHAQHSRGVAERFAGLEMVLFGHSAVVQRDQAILDHAERDLVLNLLDAEARRGLVLDNEAFDLVVSDVACPDDREVAPRRVTDPLLLAVENPGVAFTLRRRRQAAGRSGTHQRLGQAETADLFEASHRRQPLLLL